MHKKDFKLDLENSKSINLLINIDFIMRFLSSLPDSKIEKVIPENRELIADFFYEQYKRFKD